MYQDINAWIAHLNETKDRAAAVITEHSAADIARSGKILFKVAEAALASHELQPPIDSETSFKPMEEEEEFEIIEGMAGEFAFWKTVADNNFKVPTDAAVHAVASRWQRKIRSDPAFKARYGATPNPQKESFRTKWAKDMYKSCIKTREKIDSKKKDTIADKCPGART